MIKSLFDTSIKNKTIITIMASLVLFMIFMMLDYSNSFTDSSNGLKSFLFNKNINYSSALYTVMIPMVGVMALCLTLLIPITLNKLSQKLLMSVIVFIILSVTYILAVKTTHNEEYLLSKKENFLNSISNFYAQYPETDGTREMISYLNKNDYKSIFEMNSKKLRYTEIISMTNLVNQTNDSEIKKVYEKSMQDGQIDLLEKEKIDTLILQRTAQTI